MALASELQVHKDTFQLVVYLQGVVREFPRSYKYTLGQKITNVSLELFEYIQLANMFKESRVKHLNGFIVKFELLKVLLRLCLESNDIELLTLKQQANIARMLKAIGKQVTAWKNAPQRSS